MILPTPQDRIYERIIKQSVDVAVTVLVSRISGETGEVTQLIQQERISDCVVEQIVDSLVAQIRELNVEVAKATPEERLQQCTVEQTEDMPVHAVFNSTEFDWIYQPVDTQSTK